jgi:hypothetical protein
MIEIGSGVIHDREISEEVDRVQVRHSVPQMRQTVCWAVAKINLPPTASDLARCIEWVRAGARTARALDVDADLAHVLSRLQMTKRTSEVLQRVRAVDDRLDVICLNRADHVDLIPTAADRHTLYA